MASLLAICAFTVFLSLVEASHKVRRQAEFPPIGQAGVDFPTLAEVPLGLPFSCRDKIPGYYADPDAQCQVWHWCVPTGEKYSFLCPNMTVFNQIYRVCDWWYNVDCPSSPSFYLVNEDLYIVPENQNLNFPAN